MLYFGLILVRLQHNPCLSKQRIYLFIILENHSPALPRLHSDWHVELPLEPPPKATPTGHVRFWDGKGEAYPLILLCNYCSPLRLNQFSENQIRWPKSFSFLLTSSNISLSNRGRAKHRPDTAALTLPSPQPHGLFIYHRSPVIHKQAGRGHAGRTVPGIRGRDIESELCRKITVYTISATASKSRGKTPTCVAIEQPLVRPTDY